MPAAKFKATALLSCVNVFSDALNVVDLHEDGYGMMDQHGNPRIEVIYPRPRKSDIAEYNLKLDDRGFVDPNESEGYDDWMGSLAPMMNHMWPVFLHDIDAEEAATLMAEHACNCTLVNLDGDPEKYFITLNGGGMDLSFYIAAAYICCGAVPPIAVYGRGWSHEIAYQPAMGARLAQAMRKAGQVLRYRLNDVRSESLRVSKAVKETRAKRRAERAGKAA